MGIDDKDKLAREARARELEKGIQKALTGEESPQTARDITNRAASNASLVKPTDLKLKSPQKG